MSLPFLELIVGAHIGIFVVQRNDKTDIELVVWCVINKPTSLSMIIEWPSCCMQNKSFLVKFRINAPYFFKTDSIVLRVTVFIQFKRTYNLFPQAASATFSKNGLLCPQFITQFMSFFGIAILIDTHVTGDHTLYLIAFHNQINSWKTRENIHAHGLCFISKVFTKRAETDDSIAMVHECSWH